MRTKIVVTAMAVAVLGLTACGGGGSSGGAKNETGPVTLSYGVWDKNQVPTLQKIISEFHKQNSNINVKIQLTPYAQYFTTLQTAATGGGAPDVFWLNGPNFQLYASNGVLKPLDDVMKAQNIKLTDYPKALTDLYTYGGKHYALPKDFDTIGLWYNKKIFADAKVSPPTDSWTWVDMKAAAKKISEVDKAKGIYGMAANVSDSQSTWYNSVPEAGGYIISPDSTKSGYDLPQTAAGVALWVDMMKNGSSPTEAQLTETGAPDRFKAGKAAMLWNGSWAAVEYNGLSNMKNTVNVVKLPKGPVRQTSVIHGLGNVIYAKSKHPDAAAKFATFLGSKKAAEITAEAGAVIPAFNGTQDAWVKSMPQFNLKSFIDEVPDSVPYPVSKNTAAWNTIETTEMTKIFSGQVGLDTGLKELATQMNAELAKEK